MPGRTRRASEAPLSLKVEGFKAVRQPVELSIKPLTLISGANSSGKSSFIQPFLLLKQTLESAFDPGALLLYGPNAKFTESTQVVSHGKAKSDLANGFSVGMTLGDKGRSVSFKTSPSGLHINSDRLTIGERSVTLYENPTAKQMAAILEFTRDEAGRFADMFNFRPKKPREELFWEVDLNRNRCFLRPVIALKEGHGSVPFRIPADELSDSDWVSLLRGIIHVPGLRGNPERSYPRSAVGSTFPGTFETYVASILHNWHESNSTRLETLSSDLRRLGLTWKVVARRVNDASVEVLVGRMPLSQQGGAFDLVNVADVGFGVSQILPVVVALISARRGQIVYIEQPEIHLHPRAQLALADCMIRAAKRGVRVIAETHSSLIIRGVQIGIARGAIPHDQVSLNWFTREPITGVAIAESATIDSKGRFGDWPEDFDEISQEADWTYLDAVRTE